MALHERWPTSNCLFVNLPQQFLNRLGSTILTIGYYRLIVPLVIGRNIRLIYCSALFTVWRKVSEGNIIGELLKENQKKFPIQSKTSVRCAAYRSSKSLLTEEQRVTFRIPWCNNAVCRPLAMQCSRLLLHADHKPLHAGACAKWPLVSAEVASVVEAAIECRAVDAVDVIDAGFTFSASARIRLSKTSNSRSAVLLYRRTGFSLDVIG